MSNAGGPPPCGMVPELPADREPGDGLELGVHLLLKDAWLCGGHDGDYRCSEGCSPRTLQGPGPRGELGSEGCSVPAAAAGAGEGELTPLPKPCVPPLLPPLCSKKWESLGWVEGAFFKDLSISSDRNPFNYLLQRCGSLTTFSL